MTSLDRHIVSDLCLQSQLDRPNNRRARNAHDELFQRRTPLLIVATQGEVDHIGHNASSQNIRELQVTLMLVKAYIRRLSNEECTALARNASMKAIDCGTIDAFQREQKSVVIVCVVKDQKLGFMAHGRRLLAGVSCARGALVIICDNDGIMQNEHKRTRQAYENLKSGLCPDHFVKYDEELPRLPTFKEGLRRDLDEEASAVPGNNNDNHNHTQLTGKDTAGEGNPKKRLRLTDSPLSPDSSKGRKLYSSSTMRRRESPKRSIGRGGNKIAQILTCE
ncbi:DNA-binding protein SMUBP-2 [Lecanora helva]